MKYVRGASAGWAALGVIGPEAWLSDADLLAGAPFGIGGLDDDEAVSLREGPNRFELTSSSIFPRARVRANCGTGWATPTAAITPPASDATASSASRPASTWRSTGASLRTDAPRQTRGSAPRGR
jgi:hypothetical protein